MVTNNYNTDNEVFNTEDLINELLKSDQKIEFSGIGDPHHNGVIEGEINIVLNMEISMMLHADLGCTEGTINLNFFPTEWIMQFGYTTTHQNDK